MSYINRSIKIVSCCTGVHKWEMTIDKVVTRFQLQLKIYPYVPPTRLVQLDGHAWQTLRHTLSV